MYALVSIAFIVFVNWFSCFILHDFPPSTPGCSGSNMSVRVVARIRPLLEGEAEKDVIVRADTKDGSKKPTVVKIPNPKNESEDFKFSFGGVYDQSATQEALFTAEGMSAVVP